MAEINTLIASPKEGVKPISGDHPEEGNKKSFFSPSRIVGLFVLALLLVWIFNHYRGNAEVDNLNATQLRIRELQLQAEIHRTRTGSVTPSVPAPTTVALKFGTFMVSVEKGVEFNVPAGEGFAASPIATVDYDWYVNGDVFQSIRGGVADQRFSLETPTVRKVGYALPESSQVASIKFAYVRYKGDGPPKGWYPKALAQGDNSP